MLESVLWSGNGRDAPARALAKASPRPLLASPCYPWRLLVILGASVFVLQDTMESFFLSETVKYLYLLFSNASAVVDHFVLSTEVRFCCMR